MEEPRTAMVLTLHGRLVEDTVCALEPMLTGLLVAERPWLVIDLSEVAVCDTFGAAMLAGAARLALERGGELRFAAPSPAMGPWLGATITAFASVDGAVEAFGDESCVELDAWHRPTTAFGVRRPLWRVSSSDRARSRRGPASRRR
jgi:ABC-type transporter Mla MlaB component